MKSRSLWIAGGILAFVIFLIAYLPASQVLGRLSLPKNVSVSGISGTLWEGKARLIVANGLPIENLRWSLNPLSLLAGRISAELNAGELRNPDAIAFKGPVSVSLFNPDHIASEDLVLYLPADRVLANVPLPLPVNAGGRFRVRLDELAFGPACDTLRGTGDWLNATVAGTQGPIDFGSYTATLRCEGDSIGIRVNGNNLLGLSMDAVVSADFKTIDVTGQFKPDDSLPEEVHQAARFFGQPGADGYFPIDL
ncbi:type II secretion system protein N [Alteromonas sp. CYL-A6]|uniref:type II secretion system protein N n=1 Tax=Alteromonas nitratireducens TaxID=3390813 RepID=UPI0034A95C58